MKKWLLSCLFALLMLLAVGTAFAEDGIIFRDCAICGTTTQFVRVRYGGNYFINNVPSHVGYYKCSLGHGDELAYLDDSRPHTGGTATCATQAKCEVCGTPYGALLPHDFEPHEGKPATCTEDGWTAYDTCKNCDYSSRTVIPALNHDLELRAKKAPTCSEKGWKKYVCTREGCNYVARIDIYTTSHDLVHHDAKAPTCTEIGWDAYDTCQNCDYTTYAELAALGHDLVKHAAKAPTCTEGGWNAYDACSRCDYSTYTELAAKGHDLVKHAAKAPTCTDIGWEAYDACSRCDYTTYAELAAKGHDLVKHAAKASTCTEVGWDAYDACSRCDYSTYAELAALGHDYQARTIAPTCTEQGYVEHTCSRCANRYSDNWVNALGHRFVDWAPGENATHTATCLREGCGVVVTAECNRVTLTLPVEGEEAPLEISFCPVCSGLNDELALTRIETATAEAVTGSLPMGDLCLRIGALDNGEMLMTVCFEHDGALVLPTGQVKITLPAELIDGNTLVLLCEDGTLTELTPEIDGENASFTLDFTDAESPVCALRLIPIV